MGDRQADRPLNQPHHDRLSSHHPRYEEILRAHAAAMEAGDPSYLDPSSGLSVLTASFLAERGTCCSSGCRHCPYLQEQGAS